MGIFVLPVPCETISAGSFKCEIIQFGGFHYSIDTKNKTK